MDGSDEADEVAITDSNIANLSNSEKKTPHRRLIQSTLFPLPSQEKNNNGGKEEDVVAEGSTGKRKRKGKAESEAVVATPAKVPLDSQEAPSMKMENEKSMFTTGLQMDLLERLMEVDEQVINATSPPYENKTPHRRLIQSTLFPHGSQENGLEDKNEKEENNEDAEYIDSQNKSKRKGNEKGNTKCTLVKTPVNSQESLSVKMETDNSLPTNGLQIDLMERLSEEDKQVGNAISPRFEMKTPSKRLVQSTLLPHKPQENGAENNNKEEKNEGDVLDCDNQNKSKQKRKGKGDAKCTPVKTPVNSQECLSVKMETGNSPCPNDLQIDLMERISEEDKQVMNIISPHLVMKTPSRRLVQSTLLPHRPQENSAENNYKEEKNEGDVQDCDGQNKSKRKRKGKGNAKCTPLKTSSNSQEALSERIESKNFVPIDDLQSDLMARSAEVEEKVVRGISQHPEMRTPHRRLIQATLHAQRSQENDEVNNNEVEEDNEENDDFGGRQSKGKRKRNKKGKAKHTPTMKTPISCQGALSGRTECKESMDNTERNLKGQKQADSPDGDDKISQELESGSCKRRTRQSTKGQRASPHKDVTPSKLKGQRPSPRKVPTPSKLKGPHCRRIIAEDTQTEHTKELIFDLRLEEKIAAEENARLFKGRQTHPFFSSWKMNKKVQGISEATELESKRGSMLHEGQPIHVFEMLQDDPLPLDWSSWSFSDECPLDSSSNPEFSSSSCFNDPVKPLRLDNFLFTSEYLGASIPQNGTAMNYTTNKMTSADGGLCSHQLVHFGGQERYLDNSLDPELPKQFVEERMKLRYPDRGPENSLWTNKYQPRKASEVCGNVESVRFLNEWLSSWRERYSRNPKSSTKDNKRVIEDSDDSSKESDSGAESMEECSERNVLLVSGPVGSGKSAAIYACAREQGFQVIEVSASDWRNGAHIKQKFGAAMESLGLNKWSSEEPLGSRMKHILEVPSTQTSKSSIREFDDEIVEVLTDTSKGESDTLKQDPADAVVTDNLSASSRGADKTLILFEDVDTIFDEDRGLIASIQQIAETAKRPMILTSNRKDPVLPDQLDRLEVWFAIPSQNDLVSHLDMVCTAERAGIHPELLHRFVKCCHGDIRKTIMLLQFWCQGEANKRARKMQSAYTPECFDLDAGHLIIPNVIPWEFPCQLSELVEKEITKSLAMVKENASLMCIPEEEDLSSKEVQDALVTDMEAKKEAMLSMNHSIQYGNEYSVQYDCLEDFSNSLGSPVAFTRQPGRRGLCMVISSDSEDGFPTDNVPNDSNIQSMDLYNGVIPDVSHMSLGNTFPVQDYQDPPVGQFCTSPVQNPEDCFPTETDQHLCEVDISCVPESSFVPETEINGVELLSNTVSCAHAAMDFETMPLSRSLESMSTISASNAHEATRAVDINSQTTLGTTCEIGAVSAHREEIGDSQHEHAESVSRRYQVMDECSRAGFSVASVYCENSSSIGQTSSVPETWRRLRCCHEDLKSYITSEQRNASQIVNLASGLTDLISVSDLMFGRCKPLISDNLESSMVPSTEPEASCWYDEHLEMASTIAQHGFCLFANKSTERGSNLGLRSKVDLASDMLASTTSITVLGQLLAQNMNTSQSSFSGRNLEVGETGRDISLNREIQGQFYAMIQNVVPSKMYLSLRGSAFLEYVSSLGQISKLEVSRLSENIDKTKLRRRARIARHYLSTGTHMLSSEDVAFLAQNSSFGELPLKLTFR